MEEILASIRRIISEDDEPGAEGEAAEAAPAEAAEPAPEPEPQVAEEPEPVPAAKTEEEVFELTERVDEGAAEDDEIIAVDEPAPEPEFEEAIGCEYPADMGDMGDDTLVSEPVATAAASAFGDLVGQMLVSSRSTEGKTLEDIVRDLIRPMLREWLDANLRSIVEARVADEVEKIAARARR